MKSNNQYSDKSISVAIFTTIITTIMLVIGYCVQSCLSQHQEIALKKYNEKIERYTKLLQAMPGFYGKGIKEDKEKFLEAYRIAWLFASDEVIVSINEFLKVIDSKNSGKFTVEKQLFALSKVVYCIRKDIMEDETKILPKDFKHTQQ